MMMHDDALEFAAEFKAQRSALTHACRELVAHVTDGPDRAAIEESYSAAYRALEHLATIADHTRPNLRIVR